MPTDLPEWIDRAVLAAVLAAIGYLAKQLAEWLARLRREERQRRARLAALLALIRAGDTAWKVQCESRDQLADLLIKRDPQLEAQRQGFDHLFALAYPTMTPAERELHAIVRAITMHTFGPLNAALLEWLASDADFRVRPPGATPRAKLAIYLTDLEAHLLLWRAKFAAWMPQHPERALVYMADEQRHGVPFPRGGTALIERIIHRHAWVGA